MKDEKPKCVCDHCVGAAAIGSVQRIAQAVERLRNAIERMDPKTIVKKRK